MTMRRIFFILTLLPISGFSQETVNLQQARQMAIEHNRNLQMESLDRQGAALQTQSSFSNFLPRFDAEAGYQRRNKPYKLFDSDKFLPVVPWQGIDPQTGNFNPDVLQDPQLAPQILAFNPNTGEVMRDAEGNPIFQHYAWLPAEEGKIGQKNNYSMGITMRQPIYMGGKIRSGYQIAQKAENIAQAQYEKSLSEVVFRTDELYWQVISLQEKVELSQAYLEMLDQLVKDLENLFAEGIITHNQVLQARVKYNEVELLQLQAENGLSLARMALNQHIGLPLHSQAELEADFEPAMLALEEENLTEIALSQRAELHMLNQAVAIADELVKVNRADMLPSIGLMAGYNFTNPNPYNGFKDEFGGDYTIGVGISIPIYHFGDKRRQVSRARIEREKVQLQQEDAREMIELQVSQSLFSLTEARTRRELSELSQQQAEENLDLTLDLFAEGRATTRDVLEAQAHWQEAHEAGIAARNQEKIAFTRLQKNIGQLQQNH
ncbi:MAG: TolC family protein [Bacteroidetes bacterium]|nr:MAG: TolC family protein [Bacteroidota bacterium]